ncbi:MAG: right-handed parallel beta-helix repeat-containing protein [Kiritimatiellae bacterium]|nr:right-handed parallel beta-helix repeat-containing protein [Kiritimatiellia bacterium]
MRLETAVLAAVFAAAPAAAEDGRVFDVADYGAKGDGSTKDTAAIQAAIDAAEKTGGGEVYLGAGRYVSGSIYLKDNIDFHLGPGAVIVGSDNPLDYSDPYAYPLNYPTWTAESSFGSHLVVCYERRNVTVRGPGGIDGNARAFLLSRDGRVYDQTSIPWRPSQMLWFAQCEDVRVTDLEIANSTQWSCLFHGCDRVTVRGCRVHNNRHRRGTFHTQNGDGFDVDCCRWVSISDCDIDTADDGITLRASPRGPMRNRDCGFITVSNCRISSDCNAVRVGSGLVHDAVFSNLAIHDTRIAFNIVSSWSASSRGCDFSDIRFENCTVDCGMFLYMHSIYAKETSAGNIAFSGITGRSLLPGRVCWADASRCGRVLFRDVELDCGLACKNAPELEISGGRLKKIAMTDVEIAKRGWEISGYGKYADCGPATCSPYRGRKWKEVWSGKPAGGSVGAGGYRADRDFGFGLVEVKAKAPDGATRPLVRLANDGAAIDVMEFAAGDRRQLRGAARWRDASGAWRSFGLRLEKKNFAAGSHVYAAERDAGEVVLYCDGERYLSFDVKLAAADGAGEAFRRPMRLEISAGEGAAAMPVEWVKFLERELRRPDAAA